MALIQATRFNRRSKDASADPLMVAASLANHRTNAQQHHLQLIDDGERGIRHLRHLTVSSAPSLPEKNRSLSFRTYATVTSNGATALRRGLRN